MNSSEFPQRGYLLAAPASISFKKKGGKKYQSSLTCKAKAYLGFNKAGKIIFSVVGSTNDENIKITVSKYYLLQMLMCHLCLRPIQKGSQQNLWDYKGILKKNGVVPIDLEGKSLDEIKDEYQQVKSLLEEFLSVASLKDQEKAKKQYENLIEAKYKIDVLTEIERSQKILDLMNPPKEIRKKEINKLSLHFTKESEADEPLHYLSGTWRKKEKRRE
ncbi:hypothetical protein FXV91_14235 [Methanosarcina sp. DH2]|uniref:hypothetical protein n=1 Tax=Methanosarcina sp. DH2 TaxID=2605639 RepID=UPI001E452D83|nr:hypothetical protein [Methanosarcina sp. DH2]MCC4771278.1 hypothetical protein [Methanosarcina sp. DH2]